MSDVRNQNRRMKRFDAMAEGAKYGISAELASEIWHRICDEATELSDEAVRARFAQLASGLREPGASTTSTTPGKQTLVAALQGTNVCDVASPGKRTLTEAPQPSTIHGAVPGKRTLTEMLQPGAAGRGATESSRGVDSVGGCVPSGTPSTRGARSVELPYRYGLERIFGRPLGHVHAFTGAADELAPFGARALTKGNVVAFVDDGPSPSLVAHEVAHVVQSEQAGDTAFTDKSDVGSRESAAESEAENMASIVAVHGFDVRLPAIAAAPAAHVHLSPDAAGVPAVRLDKVRDAARLRSLIAMRRQPEIVELLEQNANPEHMYALHRAYGSTLVADVQSALTEASYLAKARVYLGEQMPFDAKIQARGQGDIEEILGDLERLPDVRALAMIAGEAVPIAWTQPATANWLPANTTLAAIQQALRSRVGADDAYRAMRILLGKAERALAVQVAQAPHDQHIDGFTVTMADLSADHVHASPLALSPVSHARVDLAEARIREVDASGNWMADPRKTRMAALAMTDLSGTEREALAMRLRDRPLANAVGGGMLTADALEHDDATFLQRAILDAQAIAAVQVQASRSVGLEVAMERAGELVRAARAKLEALPPTAPEAERNAAQAELARLESMFFGPGSPVLAMARTTAQRSGAADGGVAAVGVQLRALGADNLTIGAEQLRAVPAGDGSALVATLRKIAAVDRLAALQRAGLLDALANGSLTLAQDQREQVKALVWQGSQPSELGVRTDEHADGHVADAPLVLPPSLTPPLLGLRPEVVLALHDVLDAMHRRAVHEVLGRLARMPDADQRAIYADPRFVAQFNALPEGDARSANGHFKESFRIAKSSGARAALLGYPNDIDSEHKVHVEALGAEMDALGASGQANLRRAYVLVERLGGPQRVRANPVLLLSLPTGDREAVQRLVLGGDGAGLLGKRDRLERDDDKETASQLIFGQPEPEPGADGQGTGARDSATEAEFMYYRLRDAARIRHGVSIADWLITDGARADEAVAEFLVLYQRVNGADLSRGDLAQLADFYHRALRRLDSYRDAAGSLASTAAQIVGATVATIVVTVASGGALGPVAVGAMATVSATASSAAAGAVLRVHSTMESVLKDAATGAMEGLTSAAGDSLSARIVRSAVVGLPAGRAAASIGAHAVGRAGHAGAEIAAAVIDGALGGASGELFQTATDEATWDRGIAEAFAAMLAAVARGAATGAIAGAAVEGSAQAIAKLGRTIGKAGARVASDEAGVAVAGSHTPSTMPVHDGSRLEKLGTSAERGVDPTPESIRQGTVRMEDHPDFPRVLDELKEKGYTFEYTNSEGPKVQIVETVTPGGDPIGTQKYLFGNRGMRWIDLEHELGHVDQIEAMAAKGKLLATDRQLENGQGYQGQNRKSFIDAKLNSVLEYHNRLIEYFRLKDRGVDPVILRAHVDGLDRWRKVYENKASRSPTMQAFIQENIADLPELNMRWLKEKRGVP